MSILTRENRFVDINNSYPENE